MTRKALVIRWKQLQASWNRIIETRIGSFSAIGIGLTIFGEVYIAAAPLLLISKDQANLQQAIISVILNFVLNYKKTWRDRQGTNWVGWQALRFAFSKVATITINRQLFLLLMLVFQSKFGPSVDFHGWSIMTDFTFAYIWATLAIMYVNYFNMDEFVFGQHSWYEDLARMMIAMIVFPYLFAKKAYKKVRK